MNYQGLKMLQTVDLISQAKKGRHDSLNDLFERCAPRILPVVRHRIAGNLRERLESADLLQDVLLKALQSFHSFHGATTAEFLAWIGSIASTRAVDSYRREHRQMRDAGREVPLDVVHEPQARRASALTEMVLSERERLNRARVEAAMAALSPMGAEIFVMRTQEDCSWKEIGDKFQMSEDACRKLLARELSRIRKLPPGGPLQ